MLKILVVEDDWVSRKIAITNLDKFGTCDVAVNGREAVEVVKLALAEKAPYQFIYLDIMMPEMDGREALPLIRKAEAEAGIQPGNGSKIIVVSAVSDNKTIIEMFREQSDGYLVKPYSPLQLVEKMRGFGLI